MEISFQCFTLRKCKCKEERPRGFKILTLKKLTSHKLFTFWRWSNKMQGFKFLTSKNKKKMKFKAVRFQNPYFEKQNEMWGSKVSKFWHKKYKFKEVSFQNS